MSSINPAEGNPKQLLRGSEIEAEYGFPAWKLKRLKVEGKGPPYIKLGGKTSTVFYRRGLFEAWLYEQEVSP